MKSWLPTSVKEMQALGWTYADVILISGDAYVDHPSFGIAVLARLLEKQGLKVAVVPQPNWQDDLRDFKKLGRPRLFFGVSSGSMDSMINNYTGNKRKRSDDAYSPGGKAGNRPDYATTVYSRILKQLYPEVPVIIGGIEASLRRLVHYDYWSDTVKPSVLSESKADLLVYGMGEKPLKEITDRLLKGTAIADVRDIPQTAYLCPENKIPSFEGITKTIASLENCLKSKKEFALSFKTIEEESNKLHSARLVQLHGKEAIVVNPPYATFTPEEIDEPYEL
ncbi:MAG TPA: YgiQ family radical SAM protein, partial [Bacteroidales bacterium]|nr:YgiQ family radical SAM protein [Bacteroidales bacterium]